MKVFTFNAELWLPKPRQEVFAFFADARNLQAITPEWLNFEIVTPDPIEIRAGARIDYRIRVHGYPFQWQTEITEWNPPHHFVDEQRRGPYALWRHRHIFSDHEGGTRCQDLVHYRPRGGAIMNWLFVRRDVERIFAFRSAKLNELFQGPVASTTSASAA